MFRFLPRLGMVSGALVVLAGGCATHLPAPTAGDAQLAAERWPGTTLSLLTQGRSLYLDHCTGCHAAYSPASHPAQQWPAFVTEMAGRAKLTGGEADQVIRYLVVLAGDPAPPAVGIRAQAAPTVTTR